MDFLIQYYNKNNSYNENNIDNIFFNNIINNHKFIFFDNNFCYLFYNNQIFITDFYLNNNYNLYSNLFF